MASYPASTESRYDNSYTASISMGMIHGNKETEPNITCGYRCAFACILGVHASQPKKSNWGLSSEIYNAGSVNVSTIGTLRLNWLDSDESERVSPGTIWARVGCGRYLARFRSIRLLAFSVTTSQGEPKNISLGWKPDLHLVARGLNWFIEDRISNFDSCTRVAGCGGIDVLCGWVFGSGDV
jgi:hypothetical protein